MNASGTSDIAGGSFRMRLRRVVPGALLLLAMGVSSHRAFLLANDDLLQAEGEQRWFEWSYRLPVEDRLAGAARQLLPAEYVTICLGPPETDAGWWLVMARYYLPHQTVVHVQPSLYACDAEGTVIVTPDGSWVHRGN
jgi:hypothetical protein